MEKAEKKEYSPAVIGWFLCVVGFVGALFVGWVIFPAVLYSSMEQPFPFNHKAHTENAGMGCDECHVFKQDGFFTGIPKLARCMDCHESLQGKTEAEKKFQAYGQKLTEEGKEIPWLVYSKQPDCVYFSHAAHVKMGQQKCETCHGPIGTSEQPRVYKKNRITGYSIDIWGRRISGIKFNTWDRMKMDDCGECHDKNKTSNACFVCHK
ncbi:MAG: cytochrome c3 family protein [Deltaproteobacteria bacterium]|nr:cytochrome c3 family protein [Deltaproteobacteria bacterium]MBF0524901.1 cytochrome c3 family protein [Deltaproteobacteria bacterium]